MDVFTAGLVLTLTISAANAAVERPALIRGEGQRVDVKAIGLTRENVSLAIHDHLNALSGQLRNPQEFAAALKQRVLADEVSPEKIVSGLALDGILTSSGKFGPIRGALMMTDPGAMASAIQHYDDSPDARNQLNSAMIELRRTTKRMTGIGQSQVLGILNELYFGSDQSGQKSPLSLDEDIPRLRPKQPDNPRDSAPEKRVISQAPSPRHQVGIIGSERREFGVLSDNRIGYGPVIAVNSRFLYAGSFGEVRVWSLESGQEIRAFEARADPYHRPNTPNFFQRVTRPFGIYAVAPSADGETVYVGGASNQIVRYDANADVQKKMRLTPGGMIAAMSEDGRHLHVAIYDERMLFDRPNSASMILSVESNTGKVLFQHNFSGTLGPVQSLSVDRQGDLHVATHNTLLVLNANSGKVLRRVHFQNHPLATAIAFSQDAKYLLISDGSVYIVDAETGQEVRELTGDCGWAYTASLGLDKRILYTVGSDGFIREWRLPPNINL